MPVYLPEDIFRMIKDGKWNEKKAVEAMSAWASVYSCGCMG